MFTCPLDLDECERAELLSNFNQEDDDDDDNKKVSSLSGQMPKKGRHRRKATTGGVSRRAGHTRRKVRVIRGLVALKVPGHRQIQHIRASELIRHIPLIKIRIAAKRVLGRPHRRKQRRGLRRRRAKTRKLKKRHSRRRRRAAK